MPISNLAAVDKLRRNFSKIYKNQSSGIPNNFDFSNLIP